MEELTNLIIKAGERDDEIKSRNGHTFESLQKMWEDAHIEIAQLNSIVSSLKEQVAIEKRHWAEDDRDLNELIQERNTLHEKLDQLENEINECLKLEPSFLQIKDELGIENVSLSLVAVMKNMNEKLKLAQADCAVKHEALKTVTSFMGDVGKQTGDYHYDIALNALSTNPGQSILEELIELRKYKPKLRNEHDRLNDEFDEEMD